jgi:hypothetical protein
MTLRADRSRALRQLGERLQGQIVDFHEQLATASNAGTSIADPLEAETFPQPTPALTAAAPPVAHRRLNGLAVRRETTRPALAAADTSLTELVKRADRISLAELCRSRLDAQVLCGELRLAERMAATQSHHAARSVNQWRAGSESRRMQSQVAAFLEERAEALTRQERESAALLDELSYTIYELRAETNAALSKMAAERDEARWAQARLAQLATTVIGRQLSLLAERDAQAEELAAPAPRQQLLAPPSRAGA